MTSIENDIWIYCLPISGGALVSHLAILQELYDARIKANDRKKSGYFSYAPNLALGSSGGNVSIFIAQSADWTSYGIERNVEHMNSDLFLKKWTDLPLFSDIPFAIMEGSLYNHGIGARGLFNKLFTTETIQRTEFWLGTYDIKNKKAQFFCNKSQSDSYIAEPFFNEEQSLYYAMPLKFTDGNIDMLADICIASATIPATVPLKEIDGLLYADGGVMYSSPLSVLNKEIHRIITGKERVPISKSFQIENNNDENEEFTYTRENKIEEKNLRLFYFLPYQPNGLEFEDSKSDLGIRSYLNSILNVSMMQDRNTAVELLNNLSQDGLETETYMSLDSDKLANIIRFLSNKKHYVVCLFPHRNPSVNIAHINGNIMKKAMKKVRESYGCQIWYSKIN